MITPKQAEARRNNGKLSHGPVTPEGKAASAGHALKFGFFSSHPVLPGEDESAFAAYRDGLLDSLAPAGQAEQMLAEQIVSASWRLRRVPFVEASVIESHIWATVSEEARREADRLSYGITDWREVDANAAEGCQAALARAAEAHQKWAAPELALGRAFIRDATGANTLAKLTHSETFLHRVLFRSMDELRRLQATRKIEPTEGLTAIARAA